MGSSHWLLSVRTRAQQVNAFPEVGGAVMPWVIHVFVWVRESGSGRVKTDRGGGVRGAEASRKKQKLTSTPVDDYKHTYREAWCDIFFYMHVQISQMSSL